MIQPIIMAGGSGSRLWPFSRQSLPKQLLSLTDSQHSMLQDTVNRLDNLSSSDPTVICNEEYRFLVAEQLRLSGRHNSSIILEPAGRNTAPAIALAAFEATQNGDDPLLLVLAADNHIEDINAFHHAVQTATPLAESGKLVTFGIVPTAPETGYGYIQQGEPLGEQSYRVNRFVEKPDLDTAQNYINSGEYYWNSGMFLFRASQFLSELEQYRPEIFSTCKKAISNQKSNSEFIHVNKDVFLTCPSESVDYAVMENSNNVAMVSLDAGWNDIGSWSSLWEVSQKCEQGNSTTGDVIHHNTQNSLIKARHRLVATVGVENLAVIETKDAVLIARKDSVQDVKHIVEHLKNEGRQEHINHTEVQRPWGKYESIDNGPGFQAKRITVKPGAKLSVQMHYKRSEHWIVVQGNARVTNGENTFDLKANESTYIPVEQIHALENTGESELILIEVQCGSYLGEDDIVRFEDRYGRV